jgi:FkbM family methyltransferase
VSGELPRRVVVYGAGTFGRGLAEHLLRHDVEVVGLLDRALGGMCAGRPIEHPDHADWAKDLPVVLGLHNPTVSAASLRDGLLAAGHPQVVSTVEALRWLGSQGLMVDSYWLSSDPSLPESASSSIAALRPRLGDEASRRLLDQLTAYRARGVIDDLPEPLPLAEQYFAPDLLGRIDLSRILDCGAFDGDTLRALAARGVSVEWVLALEPDPTSFAALAGTARDLSLPAICLPVGAWQRTESVGFTADGRSSSSVDPAAVFRMQAVAIDELLAGSGPSFIKMDIEGAELAALAGARRTIEMHRPGLALSVYHRPTDLWEIPLWVQAHGDYDLYLRQYGENGFDTVLYALPRGAA